MPEDPAPPTIAQGDTRLLETPTARSLLTGTLPARLAYVTRSGRPRVVPTWFHWEEGRLVMATWVAGPHVSRPARRLADLVDQPDVAVVIDTDDQPPRVLQLRGRVEIDVVDGIPVEYRRAAVRYLGAEHAEDYLSGFDGLDVSMARLSLTPDWVGLLDFDDRMPGPLGGVTGVDP